MTPLTIGGSAQEALNKAQLVADDGPLQSLTSSGTWVLALGLADRVPTKSARTRQRPTVGGDHVRLALPELPTRAVSVLTYCQPSMGSKR
jgi:hypothetical protein